MNDNTRAIDAIKKLHAVYTDRGKAFDDQYTLGYRNGLEAALALLEGRPPFYLDRENNYDKLDQEEYPEYFFR